MKELLLVLKTESLELNPQEVQTAFDAAAP
jgi:hypothetical protein